MDDMNTLRGRVAKDETGWSHVEIPVSMTCHLISNILIDEEGDGEASVKSSFIVRQARKVRDEASSHRGGEPAVLQPATRRTARARRCGIWLPASASPRG